LCSLLTQEVQAQALSNLRDTTVNGWLLQVHYARHWPFADLADRFGSSNAVGGAIKRKTTRNWLWSLEGSYLFGGNIKEDTIIDGLLTSQGFFIGLNGLASSVLLFERGFSIHVNGGKMLPLPRQCPNSGVMLMAGFGVLQHKIKIEDPDQNVPYVTGAYAKGYDRLTTGWAMRQYIGYLNLDEYRRYNFELGIESFQGFTRNRRAWNFDQMKRDDRLRLDVLVGLRATWMLPFYGRSEERFYTY
ncbi:MAG: hypothetical protein NZL95_01495, partial [Chitinophagales bacterium]|nr:hypothetical protein [Chitinophagales bacterium]MDW8427210.1 hypothetical protein [Chitinophagales bacterium]